MRYTINISGTGSIDEILKSLEEISSEIKSLKEKDLEERDFDYLDGFEYEDEVLLVSLNSYE